MPIEGTINSLYLDYEQTKPLFPRTKTKAVSADSGVSLDVLLDEMNYNISNKAPAGFGLGNYSKTISDWNEATLNGWYRDPRNAANTPFPGHFTIGFVSNYQEDCVQNVYAREGYGENHMILHAMRTYDADFKVWGKWEYVNPPALTGVEYRTTEVWYGMPVYVQTVHFGLLPNNSSKAITISASGVTNVVSYSGRYTNGEALVGAMLESDNAIKSNYQIHETTIGFTITTTADFSTYSANITLKYVKN